MKVLSKKVVVKSKEKGVPDSTYINYYLELDNGYRVAIKPCFPNDYGVLRTIALRVDCETK